MKALRQSGRQAGHGRAVRQCENTMGVARRPADPARMAPRSSTPPPFVPPSTALTVCRRKCQPPKGQGPTSTRAPCPLCSLCHYPECSPLRKERSSTTRSAARPDCLQQCQRGDGKHPDLAFVHLTGRSLRRAGNFTTGSNVAAARVFGWPVFRPPHAFCHSSLRAASLPTHVTTALAIFNSPPSAWAGSPGTWRWL